MVAGDRQYRTKQFTVTVEPHSDEYLKGFYWVRIYANCWDVAYCGHSKLLLSCSAGRHKPSTLLKRARPDAVKKLRNYRERAQTILDITLNDKNIPVTA